MTERGYTWRMIVVVTALTAAFAGLAARLAYLHLGPNQNLQQRIADIRKVEQNILVEVVVGSAWRNTHWKRRPKADTHAGRPQALLPGASRWGPSWSPSKIPYSRGLP